MHPNAYDEFKVTLIPEPPGAFDPDQGFSLLIVALFVGLFERFGFFR
jgi:hypothetical protein